MNNLPYKELISNIDKAVEEMLNSGLSTHGLSRVLRLLKKESEIYKANIQGRIVWEKNRSKFNSLTKLQIGSGKHVLEGFLNVDILPPADLICDIREGIPLESSKFEFIFSEHVFEHLDYPTSLKKVVSESYRLLNSGGDFVLGLPDAGKVLKMYFEKDFDLFEEYLRMWYSKRDCLEHFNTMIDMVNYVFRDQDDSEKYNPHYWAYDFDKIENMLKSAGFKTVNKWEFDEKIANPKREFGSIYVIAKK